MTKRIRVTVRRDAWINYTTIIDGDDAMTAEQAAQRAERAWKDDDGSVAFEEDGLSEFDEILVDPDDCEEVDAEGNPITQEDGR